MPSKVIMILLGRLPLLFILDCVSRGTFKDFIFSSNTDGDTFLLQVLWNLILLLVTLQCIVLVFSPMNFILDFYRWIAGAALIWLSYCCNTRYIEDVLSDGPEVHRDESSVKAETSKSSSNTVIYSSNLLAQLLFSLAFDQISVSRVLDINSSWVFYCRYPMDIALYMSFSLPLFLESVSSYNFFFKTSAGLSIVFPLLVLGCHLCCAVHKVSQKVIVPGVLRCKTGIREIGVDGLLMSIVEKANLSMLLRLFFVAQVVVQIVLSKTLQNLDGSLKGLMNIEVSKLLFQEILYNMCGTLISVISLASVVTVLSGFSLSCVYKVIQANDEDESLQPVVSGFLFVLCAMQTGITSVTGDLRLQLLFQNSVLLVVANQHFVHNVATDLLLKASIDDTTIQKHIRPFIPFIFFFSFPFLVVIPLWSYPFRISWLLAVTVFCIELIVKSISTLVLYSINMLHLHTRIFTEDTDNLIFYVKGVCGCLEFICGIFLFLNGAYIFIYESGGFIRLFMMTMHFYCNIYQSLMKGWATYKLRVSAWDTVNRLEPATQEQLDENDTCPICYQEMKMAVGLSCSHIFHRTCLQKWLSIKETCPLCHGELQKVAADEETRGQE